MNKSVIVVASLLLSALASGTSWGQVTTYSVTRSVAAEVASIENSAIVGRVGEMYSDGRQVDYMLVANAESAGAMSAAGSEATWSGSTGSLVASGSLSVENSLSELGGERYFNCWATLVGEFMVTGASSYTFAGSATGDAVVLFHLENFDTGAAIDQSLPMGTLDFRYSGALPGSGTYQFSVGLLDLRSATEVFVHSESVAFEVSIVAEGFVSAESSSWGSVKALFR